MLLRGYLRQSKMTMAIIDDFPMKTSILIGDFPWISHGHVCLPGKATSPARCLHDGEVSDEPTKESHQKQGRVSEAWCEPGYSVRDMYQM